MPNTKETLQVFKITYFTRSPQCLYDKTVVTFRCLSFSFFLSEYSFQCGSCNQWHMCAHVGFLHIQYVYKRSSSLAHPPTDLNQHNTHTPFKTCTDLMHSFCVKYYFCQLIYFVFIRVYNQSDQCVVLAACSLPPSCGK